MVSWPFEETIISLVITNSCQTALTAGTSIRDAATNNATLTLPGLAAAGSLGTNKNIIIDTAAPTVSNVTSSVTDGGYTTGAVIPIQVTFSEAVIVTGTPTLALATGSPASTLVNYTSGTDTNILTITYTFLAGTISHYRNDSAPTHLPAAPTNRHPRATHSP